MEAEPELWTDIKDFPYYRISSCGRVYSQKTNKYLKHKISSNKSHRIMFYHQGKQKILTIHRLVYCSFKNKDYFQTDFEVIHVDKDVENNVLSNLAYQETENQRVGQIKRPKPKKDLFYLLTTEEYKHNLIPLK